MDLENRINSLTGSLMIYVCETCVLVKHDALLSEQSERKLQALSCV